jgi:hypothetical protein
VIRLAQLRGYLLEEALAWLLRNAGYRLLVDKNQDVNYARVIPDHRVRTVRNSPPPAKPTGG